MFHKQQGSPNITIPILDHRPVDIWALRKAVNKAGGLGAVSLMIDWFLIRPQMLIDWL